MNQDHFFSRIYDRVNLIVSTGHGVLKTESPIIIFIFLGSHQISKTRLLRLSYTDWTDYNLVADPVRFLQKLLDGRFTVSQLFSFTFSRQKTPSTWTFRTLLMVFHIWGLRFCFYWWPWGLRWSRFLIVLCVDNYLIELNVLSRVVGVWV